MLNRKSFPRDILQNKVKLSSAVDFDNGNQKIIFKSNRLVFGIVVNATPEKKRSYDKN
jgi:hypothetical protein